MALKVEDNPPALLAPLDDPQVTGRLWCVVRTKARREKKLAWHLVGMRVPYYLPMQERQTVSRNKTFTPVFPGFLFMTYDPHDDTLDRARESFCVASYMFTRNQPRLRQELAMMVYGQDSLQVEHRNLRTGDAVEVVSGPMKGLNGRVARTPESNEPRLFVEIQLLGQVVSVPIDPKLLRAL